jgi:hypothetical protein
VRVGVSRFDGEIGNFGTMKRAATSSRGSSQIEFAILIRRQWRDRKTRGASLFFLLIPLCIVRPPLPCDYYFRCVRVQAILAAGVLCSPTPLPGIYFLLFAASSHRPRLPHYVSPLGRVAD